MRVLVLMRGTPSSGKSTWIKENGLEEYALSADAIRMLYRSRVLNKKGRESIDQSVNSLAWKTLFEILEKRMAFGEFTIIDACNSKAKELNAYKSLAEQYRYRMYCVDFTDIPIETAKEWNKNRPEFKQVPDEAIDLYYSRFETQKIPSGIKIVSREEALDEIEYKPTNLSEYKNIYVIGDIHGCNTALMELLKEGILDENYYIFLGDYLDRGIENKEVLEFIISIKDKPNVCLIEGNHEVHLWNYANDLTIRSDEFLNYTLNQIKDIDKKELRQLYRKLRQCAYFEYNGQKFFCCHAGVSALSKNPIYIATHNFIKGVGTYEEVYECEETFSKLNPDIIQIHGHRNLNETKTKASSNCYNLEGKVEFGGTLRAVKINKEKIEEIEIKNNKVSDFDSRKPQEIKEEVKEEISIKEMIEKLREDKKAIRETTFNDFGISSFNFSKSVFYDKNWNDVTTKARGLFINTNSYTIASRAYEKFFNIGERRETELGMLSKTFTFPVDMYLKYNGFLGILGYDELNDKLLFCSKSSINGDFAKYFENIFMSKYADRYDEILKFVKENNVSFVFEVIDKDNDPHIIKYTENDVILLDIVKRELEFKKFKYEDMCNIAKKFGMKHKEKSFTINSWGEFLVKYNEITDKEFKHNGTFIEGFVIEDSKGFMTKLKGEYYNFWKYMRKVKDEVFRVCKDGKFKGYIERTASLIDAESNLFYGFIKELAANGYNGKTDIITLRDLYMKC